MRQSNSKAKRSCTMNASALTAFSLSICATMVYGRVDMNTANGTRHLVAAPDAPQLVRGGGRVVSSPVTQDGVRTANDDVYDFLKAKEGSDEGRRGEVASAMISSFVSAFDASEAGNMPTTAQIQRELANTACLTSPSATTCPACFLNKSCCIKDYFNVFGNSNTPSCGSNSVKFNRVSSFSVFGTGWYACTCNGTGGATPCIPGAANQRNCQGSPIGTVFGACRGNDDLVEVQFNLDIDVAQEYNIGLYVNTQGGDANTGTGCKILGLTERDALNNPYKNAANQTIVSQFDAAANQCLDFSASGSLVNYPFQKMTLKCVDIDNNKLLDFSVGAAFTSSAGAACTIDGPIQNTTTNTFVPPPIPGTSSKCWEGGRITLNIDVPPFPSPTTQPSISTMPSSEPSISSIPTGSPSLSNRPSSSPSVSSLPTSQPSISSMPSINPSISSIPSGSPSTSNRPSSSPSVSSLPTSQPSISSMPSFNPSISSIPSGSPSISSHPSISPSVSSLPTSQPSISSMPSINPSISSIPSGSPSISSHPSISPSVSSLPTSQPSVSSMPSFNPSISSIPSGSPSISSHPSISPSVSSLPTSQPSVSSMPSLNPSQQPSSTTSSPSWSPSLSQKPSTVPSALPSTSSEPSLNPTITPSAAPSEAPTGSLYYPDWINDSQKCLNDGLDPLYMLQIQRDNYLYLSKEECCQNHFWWRIAQCMANAFPLYVSNGSYCEQKVEFEDWESKYSPGTWEASDLFDTLKECCNAKFWWDPKGCIAKSPKALSFEFEFKLKGLIDPTICQDADIIGNALEVAMNVGLGGAVGVVKVIDDVTIRKDPDTGNAICGGRLDGISFIGDDYDGSRPDGFLDFDLNKISTIKVEVSTSCGASACASSADIDALYDKILADFESFMASGSFQTEIREWANERNPPVPQLFLVEVVTPSLSRIGTLNNPLSDSQETIEEAVATASGSLSVPNFVKPADDVSEAEAKMYFEIAITSSLGDDLPNGAVVTVTSIENGVISYVVTMAVDLLSTDASAAITLINTSLASASTLGSITTLVTTAFSSSANPSLANAMSGLTVTSHTPGSTSELILAKVTTTGKFTTNLEGALSPENTADFENAIAIALKAKGAWPRGSTVTISEIDENGLVSFSIVLLLPVDADNAEKIRDINSNLSSSSVWTIISDNVTFDTLTISAFNGGETGGVSFRKWYPDWSKFGNYCKNDGDQPPFMNDVANQEYYLFATKSECCATWYSSDSDCDGQPLDPSYTSVEKYVPDYAQNSCSKKTAKDLETYYEGDRYNSLEECCSAKFSQARQECCGDDCVVSGEVVYLPDWTKNKCFPRSKQTLIEWESTPSFESELECCKDLFGWAGSGCLDS